MELKTAKAHLRMLGFKVLQDEHGYPSHNYYTNNKGMVLQHDGTRQSYWNSSMLCAVGYTKPAKKLARFLNGDTTS